MRLTSKTKIGELLKAYPFLLDFLAGLTPRFEKLKNPVMRHTLGKVASLAQVASFGDFPLEKLLRAIAAEVKRVRDEDVPVDLDKAAPPQGQLDSKEARLEVLKDIIRDLHQGETMEVLKRRFAELIKDVGATEIAEMEQRLIEEGMSELEVKRLCDVHVQVFKESLEGQTPPDSVPGHPLHTLREENRALGKIIAATRDLLGRLGDTPADASLRGLKAELQAKLDSLAEVEKHYLKKENQLFPLLEARGVSGPSKVMWAIHDDIRAHLKETARALESGRARDFVADANMVLTEMADMIYKEEKILFPMSLETLAEADWARVKSEEAGIGFAWIEPGTEWKPAQLEAAPAAQKSEFKIPLDTGDLTPEQASLMLIHLPVDITFVDETDSVAFYSANPERIFTRVPAVIGRKVQNCHPPDSVHIVNRILDAFRKGEKSAADFWIQMAGRFILIRYFAVRDAKGAYRGCLEVSQDITEIKTLQGQKRLLDWK